MTATRGNLKISKNKKGFLEILDCQCSCCPCCSICDGILGTNPKKGAFAVAPPANFWEAWDIFIAKMKKGCHGKPERCLTVNGQKMKRCARCVGINIGQCLAVGMFLAHCLPPWWLSCLFFGIMLVDWALLQEILGIMSTNPRRLVTGILGGIAIGSLFWTAASYCVQWAAEWGLKWAIHYVTH